MADDRKSGRELAVVSTVVGTSVSPWWKATVGTEPEAQSFDDLTTQVNGSIRALRDEDDATSRTLPDKLSDELTVTDFGADPLGVDPSDAAFAAADAAAILVGGTVVVPHGVFNIAADLEMASPMEYRGRLALDPGVYWEDPNPLRFSEFLKRHDTSQEAFESMMYALYRSGRPRTADGEGLTVEITGSIDMAEVTGLTTFSSYHRISNFNLVQQSDQANTTVVMNGSITSNVMIVASTAALSPGMEVTGSKVGRGVFVKTVDSATQITLNVPAWADTVTQSYTFVERVFMLDWGGFASLSRLYIDDNQINCANFCSGIRMQYDGIGCYFGRNRFTNIKDRGLIDYWRGSGGLSFEENDLTFSTDTQTTGCGIIATSNDVKVRNNRITTCLHHQIYHGGGILILGNHWWGGDQAGLIFTGREYKSTVIGNYIDNNWVELSDECANLDNSKFLGLINITGNHWTSNDAPSSAWRFIKVVPHVTDRPLAEISVTSNTFKDFANGSVPFRVDGVDETNGTILHGSRTRVFFIANGFKGINHEVADPCTATVTIAAASETNNWSQSFENLLPFDGQSNTCIASVLNRVRDVSDVAAYPGHHVLVNEDLGGSQYSVQVRLPGNYSGRATLTVSSNTVF